MLQRRDRKTPVNPRELKLGDSKQIKVELLTKTFNLDA